MNILFTCGGTAGHVNPAIALAKEFQEKHPGCRVLFVGAENGIENTLVPKEGYDLRCVSITNFRRSFAPADIAHNLGTLVLMSVSKRQAKAILNWFKPDLVVGTGGYASFPIVNEASKHKIPTAVHESNAVPGLTTKMAAGKASKVLVAYEESARYYRQPEKVEVVGMPVRREFITTNKAEARAKLGLDQRPLVVSAFGSQGARVMNQVVADLMHLEKEAGYPFQHIHASGVGGFRWMPDHLKGRGVAINDGKAIDVREYIYDMPTVMAAADVIISRAGASTCNEIAASGTPCILIPSPNVTNNHQEKNARVFEKRGAAIVICEPDCTGEVMFRTLTELLADDQRCRDMSVALRNMAVLDCAEQICDKIEELVSTKN